MSFSNIIRRTWQKNILFSVLLELTYNCSHSCFFCYNDRKLQGQPLSLKQYYQLLHDLHDLQVMNLTLTGGEPLLHPQFWEIGSRAKELGFVLRIKSNGHEISSAISWRLKEELSPFSLELSLHGATPMSHEQQNGVKGSFAKLLQNINEMKKAGLRIQLNSVLTSFNEHEIEAMYKLADDLDITLIIDPQITTRDNGDSSPQDIAVSDKGLKDLFRIQAKRGFVLQEQECSGEGTPGGQGVLKNCGAGSSALAIDPYGNVYPCVAYRRFLGNLHKQTVKEIWSDNKELDRVRSITEEAGELIESHGPLAYSMGFCPGQAATSSGDPLTIYPAAYRNLKFRKEGAGSK